MLHPNGSCSTATHRRTTFPPLSQGSLNALNIRQVRRLDCQPKDCSTRKRGDEVGAKHRDSTRSGNSFTETPRRSYAATRSETSGHHSCRINLSHTSPNLIRIFPARFPCVSLPMHRHDARIQTHLPSPSTDRFIPRVEHPLKFSHGRTYSRRHFQSHTHCRHRRDPQSTECRR